jgi:hypothetical protein
MGIQTSSINNGPISGFKNAIINGNFDFWQRGTSFTGNEYGADRWLSTRVGSAQTVTRESFALGQTDVPGEPEYYARSVVSSVAGAGNYALYQQRIEDVRTFAGQQVTLSFWAKADATKNIAIEFTQSFGSGGSPSAEVEAIGSIKKALTTSWQKITQTVTIPSISGKTLGTDNNSYLRILFWFDAGSNFNANTDSLGQQSGTFDIAQVQIEAGPVATEFERRPIGTELALCQRYFEKGDFAQTLPISNVSVTASYFSPVYFATAKRAVPTITGTSNQGTFGVSSTRIGSFSAGRTDVVANRGNTGTYDAAAEL